MVVFFALAGIVEMLIQRELKKEKFGAPKQQIIFRGKNLGIWITNKLLLTRIYLWIISQTLR